MEVITSKQDQLQDPDITDMIEAALDLADILEAAADMDPILEAARESLGQQAGSGVTSVK